ncbi:MAG: GTP 3',8-cyclase MoaA [Ruminococcaceae bacterium]|nr:GTP 3',8-cyclase MoaA [Oscillospiraceae bacterium]MBR3595407.1 GTP 3',8-cyclase MoaA [Clostridia bacterium]
MKDKLGREINYLRISVTKRCNLNCSYCGSKKAAREKELTVEEIKLLTEAFAEKGIKKVRLTGGEPLMREDITEIAQAIKNIHGIEALYITTNATELEKKAAQLKKSGVDGINISLDALDREMYRALTGVDRLSDALKGFYAALGTGFQRVRINSVLVRGKNDGEAEKLISLARDYKTDVRFIELMPFSSQGENRELVVKTAELLERFPFLTPVEEVEEGAAKYYTAEGFRGRVGFISPRSGKFCSECNRVRILSDGRIKPCLGNELTYDIREFIEDKKLLSAKIDEAIFNKPVSHHFEDGENFRGLNLIGG